MHIIYKFWKNVKKKISIIIKSLIDSGTTYYLMKHFLPNTYFPIFTSIICGIIVLSRRWPGNYFNEIKIENKFYKFNNLIVCIIWCSGLISVFYNWFSLLSFYNSVWYAFLVIIPSLIALESFKDYKIEKAKRNLSYIINNIIKNNINKKAIFQTITFSILGALARSITFYYIILTASYKSIKFLDLNIDYMYLIINMFSLFSFFSVFITSILTYTVDVYIMHEPSLLYLSKRPGYYSNSRLLIMAPLTTYELLSTIYGSIKINYYILIKWGINSKLGFLISLLISMSNSYNYWHSTIYPATDRISKIRNYYDIKKKFYFKKTLTNHYNTNNIYYKKEYEKYFGKKIIFNK